MSWENWYLKEESSLDTQNWKMYTSTQFSSEVNRQFWYWVFYLVLREDFRIIDTILMLQYDWYCFVIITLLIVINNWYPFFRAVMVESNSLLQSVGAFGKIFFGSSGIGVAFALASSLISFH